MACPANTLLSDAASNRFIKLDDRLILLAIIGTLLPGAGNPTASTVLSGSANIHFCDDRMLHAAVAEFLCEQI